MLAEHIAGYLQDLDTADRHEGEGVEARSTRLVEKIERLRAQMAAQVEASPDGQVSLTDPDARAMATSGRGSGIVGYNVQSAVEGEHHLIIAHEVVRTGSDRQQLASMTIWDHGSGVPDSQLPHLAERFFRGRSVRPAPGSGLGLAIVASMATSQNADFSLYNRRRRPGLVTVLTYQA